MIPRAILSEFVSGFLAEADELLSLASTSLLAAEAAARRNAASPRAVRDAFRALHTIKGLAAMVGVEPIVAIAHRMETSLRIADQAGGSLALPAVDALLQGVQAIQERVRALGAGGAAAEAPAALLARLDDVEAPTPAERPLARFGLPQQLDDKLSLADRQQLLGGLAAGKLALQARFLPSSERAAQGVTIGSVREQVGKLAEIVKVLPMGVPPTAEAPGGLAFVLLLLSPLPAAALASALQHAGLEVADLPHSEPALPMEPEPADDPGGAGVVRVEVARLDDAMERLSALIVTRFRLSRAVTELAATGADVRKLGQILAENARQLRGLRAAVLKVRMVPAAELLERVPLLVRGLQRKSGKPLRVRIDAGAAEVDKAVAERLFPAVVHLIRNAVDHGIELPAERRARGKPEEALLRITCAARSGNRLELTVADDGRGIDAVAVARKAGREIPESSAALLDLLCLPGLSTADEVTTTSGRGMGMEIVKRVAVDQLGGELSLETTKGQGAAFTLRVPLTLTIVDALIFEAAEQRYAVPLSVVEEIFELEPGRTVNPPSRRTHVTLVQRRGEALPVVQLAALLGNQGGVPAGKALVIRRGGEPMGFAVQRMLGQQEVVIRPLEDPLLRVPGITGATDLGDGQPTLVLDLPALGAAALGQEAA